MAAACRTCGAWLMPRKMTCHICGDITPNDINTVGIAAVSKAKTTTLDQVVAETVERASVGQPWDDCFGGGIVWTSSTLVGGAPGSGKTTGLIQILSRLATLTGRRGYLISAEQSPGDIKITTQRLQIPNIDRFRVLSEFGAGADIDEELLKEDPPAGIVVDSVSALVGKDTHAAIVIARKYKLLAVKYKAPAFLICHMTKEHDYAGLMALQHEVDALLTVFPDDDGTRTLKPWKNRYGPTHAEYKLMMTELGLFPVPEKEKKGKQKPLLGVASTRDQDDEDDDRDEDDEEDDERDDDRDERDERDETPARKKKQVQVPPTLELNGQKLVRRPKKGEVQRPSRASAVEGEALKRKRPAMPRVKELKEPLKASIKEHKERKAKVPAVRGGKLGGVSKTKAATENVKGKFLKEATSKRVEGKPTPAATKLKAKAKKKEARA
jgi:hypothetical protein